MATVKCPNSLCGQSVPFGRFCCYCNTEFVMQADRFAGWDAYVFLDAAQAMLNNMRNTRLVRIQALKVPGDGSLPNLKEIHVETGMRLFLYSSAQPRPVQLMPGTYSTEDVFQRHGLATSIQPFEDQSWCCFCKVPTQPISVVVALPDFLLLKDALTYDGQDMRVLMDMIANGLRKLSLVDRDSQMGGANLQLDFRCSDPARFMETVAQEFIEDNREDLETRGAQSPDRIIKARKVPAKVDPPPPWWTVTGLYHRVKAGLMKVVGVEEKERMVGGPPSELLRFEYTMENLYRSINMQFRSAIQDALRNMTVAELFENRGTVGRQVEQQIQATIGRRLHNYGFEIAEVSAFEFICPGFTRMREKENKIRESKQALELQQQTAEINQQTADLTQQELNTADVRDTKTQKERLGRQADIGAVQDQHAKAAMLRTQEARYIENTFNREEKVAESAVNLDIEKKRMTQEMELEFHRREKDTRLLEQKMKAAAELQMQLNGQEYLQLEKFITLIKEMDPQSQQLMIAARDPQLAALWTSAQQQLAQQDIIKLQQQHQVLLKDAHSQSSKEIADFMKQVAALFSQVVGNRIGGPPSAGQVSHRLADKSHADATELITPAEENKS